MTHKRSVKQWMGPREVWGKNKASQGAGKQRKRNWLPPEGRVTLVIPVLSSLKKMGAPGSGKPTGAEDDEVAIKHKRKHIVISSKEEAHLHWQLSDNFASTLHES